MVFKILPRLSLSLLLLIAIFFNLPQPIQQLRAAEVPMISDGRIVRADFGSTRVYLIENGQKRWIVSGEAFSRQGLNWADLKSVPAATLAAVPEGLPLTIDSALVLQRETVALPDLIPQAPRDLKFTTLNGRAVIRFTANFANLGSGPLELVSRTAADSDSSDGEELDTFQRLSPTSGATRTLPVGNFTWHAPHNHYHYSDFADYIFELARPTAGTTTPLPQAITQKTTFCMRDNELSLPLLPGVSRLRLFTVCGKFRQGVSAGWVDVYPYTLPDQYVDVQDLPAGIYRLSFHVDPRKHFVELNQSNNFSSTLVELDVQKGIMKVLASAAAFSTKDNFFPDRMLVRATGDNRIYIIEHNKKRWLRSDEVIASYGLAAATAFEFPASVIEAIPSASFVRAIGASRIFKVNAAGYRRYITSPVVLSAYGPDAAEVFNISQAELDSYPETDLINLIGDSRVFSTASKKIVGTLNQLSALGREPASVHSVNQIDFNSYLVQIIAKNLNIPWDIVFLPDGDLLVTERSGTMQRIGKNPAIITLPSVLHSGEGGLMGLALHPNFANNRFLYAYFTTANQQNRIARFQLNGDTLIEEKIIVDGIPSALYHDGGQLAFGPDGMLYVTTGDAEEPALAQNLNSLAGKTLRYTADGSIPADNPFPNSPIWSYGHRNAQGIAWDDQGRMWQTEHGRSGILSGFDELNLIEKGKNYGWPTIQGPETAAGMVTPVLNSGSTSTWAPSGLAFVDGKLFFAGLRGASLYEAQPTLNGVVVNFAARLVNQYGRLRAVVVGPDGFIYLTTSNRDSRGTPKPGDDLIIKVHQDLFAAIR